MKVTIHAYTDTDLTWRHPRASELDNPPDCGCCWLVDVPQEILDVLDATGIAHAKARALLQSYMP